MRIGVVCEGQTDFIAIEAFLGHSLKHHGITAEFEAIQPEMDNSSPAGWGHVLMWLVNNPPRTRVLKLFGGGLFGGNLARPPLDCLLIHLDTDILGHDSFNKYIKKKFGYTANSPTEPIDRGQEISDVLKLAWREQDITDADNDRHVPAMSVESTENWCVAAFSAQPDDFELLSAQHLPDHFELLSGQHLVDCFMSALEKSEGRHPNTPYAEIDKNIPRRRKFCKKHAHNSRRVSSGCHHFKIILEKLMFLNKGRL